LEIFSVFGSGGGRLMAVAAVNAELKVISHKVKLTLEEIANGVEKK
jgi:hypothetical protein